MICTICKTLSDTDGQMENGSSIRQQNFKAATNSKIVTCREYGPQQDRSWRSLAPCNTQDEYQEFLEFMPSISLYPISLSIQGVLVKFSSNFMKLPHGYQEVHDDSAQ